MISKKEEVQRNKKIKNELYHKEMNF